MSQDSEYRKKIGMEKLIELAQKEVAWTAKSYVYAYDSDAASAEAKYADLRNAVLALERAEAL